MKSLIKNKYFQWLIVFLVGIILGWLFFKEPSVNNPNKQNSGKTQETIWTCAMHPQIRSNKPGKCPICGMDLIPLTQATTAVKINQVEMTEEAVQLANIQTTIVKKEKPEKELRLYGRIEADERTVQTIPAYISGRIERLFVNFTGEVVNKGQTIATIYSPDLIQAQQELIEAKKLNTTVPGVLEAARNKLRTWKLTPDQILNIENSEKVITNFQIRSTLSGTITKKLVNQGDYISQGTPLYEVADFSRVWAVFDAYESDLPWILKGDVIQFTVESMPENTFKANVSFISPIMEDQTRVAKVRAEIKNSGYKLKPGMFTTGILQAHLKNLAEKIIIPHSSVLWTGKRSVVYIKVQNKTNPTFELREVVMGPDLGTAYVILNGIREGDEIVTNGAFSIDATAQLMGKTSMMNFGIFDSTPDYTSQVTKPLSDDLNEIFRSYISLKSKLVSSDDQNVFKDVSHLITVIEKAGASIPDGDAHDFWTNKSSIILMNLKGLNQKSSIDDARKVFIPVSENMIKIFKSFGTGKNKAYIQFCPMANNKRGAFWISNEKQIKNPYYGNMMLNCGETRDSL